MTDYENLVEEVKISLLKNMKESAKIKKDEWTEIAQDLITELRSFAGKELSDVASRINNFFINRNKNDNYTDFSASSVEIANDYLRKEYI